MNETVTLRGGLVVDLAVVLRMVDIEMRGGKFVPQDGRFKVEPQSILTAADISFLKANGPDARAIVAYSQSVDDSHLREGTS